LSGEEKSKKRTKYHDTNKSLKKTFKKIASDNIGDDNNLVGAVSTPAVTNGYTTYSGQSTYGLQASSQQHQGPGHDGYSIKNILSFAAQQYSQSINTPQACSASIKRK